LEHLLKTLPSDISIALDLAFPTATTEQNLNLHPLNLNLFVDSILRTILNVSESSEVPARRRKIAFLSFSPDVCSALNWKQPNYPVFFGTKCGKDKLSLPNPTAFGSGQDDKRSSSVGCAVEFAKANNLLGVFVERELLTQVPSLIDGIRSAELLVGVYGTIPGAGPSGLSIEQDNTMFDAIVSDDVMSFIDNSMREMA